MAANAVVRARIDEKTKKKAAKVFKSMGLTTSSAFRMFLVRTATEQRLPFELIPNAETVAAMKELKNGGGSKSYTSIDELMTDLNAGD
jgi:DNA-damage-inducible protein J